MRAHMYSNKTHTPTHTTATHTPLTHIPKAIMGWVGGGGGGGGGGEIERERGK